MFTLIFAVCNTLSGQCYSTTSGIIYKDEVSCQQDALEIVDRVKEDQKLGLAPPEEAIYVCYDWGKEA